MVCILVDPCALVIKPRCIPTRIAITPKPLPPDVTRSPEVFRSLAKPLTGWPKSQKYLNVCCCTNCTNAESEMMENLSDGSNCVKKSRSILPDKAVPETDFSKVLMEKK